MPKQERYTPEEAMQESSKMQATIKSGEAGSYNEAERLLVESKQLEPTVADLKRITEELRAQVEAAQAQREKDVEQKVGDREALIAETRKNDELLQAAQGALEYFFATQELGELKDSAAIKKYEELKTLVASLEKQRLDIHQRIDTLTRHPEVGKKLYDSAKQEDQDRTAKKIIEQAREQLNPQIDALAKSIRNYAERRNSLFNERRKQEEFYIRAAAKSLDLIKEARSRLSSTSELADILDDVIRKGVHKLEEDFFTNLQARRKLLGWFAGKEKAEIDFLLARREVFTAVQQEGDKLDSLQQKFEATDDEDKLVEEYRAIITNAWEAEDKVQEKERRASGLPSDLSWRLENHMQVFADLERREGGKTVGRHKGWFEATQKPENDTLYHIWKQVTEKAGGLHMIYNNPKAKKKQE